MAQTTRQTRLFAAEDYTVVYDSFINANLQAFDYDTVRTAMVEYVRNNYPENYNDWIESAEFVALLDVVAQFGHNLAFRIDLNTRNNFLSTAERQDSIFKLAEFLGYQPKRNVPAFGDMKIVSIKTNEAVIGSDGTSLGGKEIRFETTNNVNNLDDFITAMNAVMQSSNSFGSPRKQVIKSGVNHQFYNLNNEPDQIKFDISGKASGLTATYNIVSINYNESTTNINEQSPNRNSTFGIVYKSDGNGISSNNTGFFVGVKQGTLQFKDVVIDQTLDSLKLDVDVENINQSDVWVDTIDQSGNVTTSWTKVENVYGQNEVYNSLPGTERNIFSVKTRENNQISVCFPDRNFGNLPKGKIRIWYRTSVNNTFTVRPDDLGSQRISVTYTGIDGNKYVAVIGIQLKSPISTAVSSESMDSIKVNAPRNYSAQNRMITASDYNNVIQTHSENVVKTKTINRTHSGHSRYISNVDPTGAYSSLNIYGKDGVLFSHPVLNSVSSTTNLAANQLYNKHVKNILNNVELLNLYYTNFSESLENLNDLYVGGVWTPGDYSSVYEWQTQGTSDASGYFVLGTESVISRVGNKQSTYLQYVTVGAMLEFTNATGDTVKWAKVSNINNNGLGLYNNTGEPTGLTSTGQGAVVLDTPIGDGFYLKTIYPAFSRVFNEREKSIILSYINSNKTFAMYYNYTTTSWEIFEPTIIQSHTDEKSLPFGQDTDSWLLWFDFANSKYDIYTRTLRFEFMSEATEFNNIANEYKIDTYTLKSEKDTITILGDGWVEQGDFVLTGYYTDNNGVGVTNRVIVSLVDDNSDNRPNNPRAFVDIVGDNTLTTGIDLIINGPEILDVDGVEDQRFEWNHNPDDNILVDPSFTNVIDVFVLSRTYDTAYRNYITDSVNNQAPLVPSTTELKGIFSSVVHQKAMSDSIVYRPVTYKPLFGDAAIDSLRARFRIIKVKGSNITDTDVKFKTIEKINEFFAVENWDFGETFYFTELAAYVHQEMSGIISSFVIVPQGASSVFGDLFEITPLSSEMFIPDVSITDIDIISTITDANIRAGQ